MEKVQKGGLRSPYEQGAQGWRPQYVVAPRLVGYLACGELAVEPVLGPVRVMEVVPGETDGVSGEEFVRVGWRDEHGPGTATGRYPADRVFDVRMPDQHDRLLVRQGIDQAKWHKREVTDDTARLIAAHLNGGASSALHGFRVNGSIGERLYDELEAAARHRPYAREWVDVLARYCLARADTGPVAAWARQATAVAEARAEEWLTAAGISVDALHDHTKINGNGKNSEVDRKTPYRDLLSKKQIKTEMAAQLIDAAFTLGLEAGRTRARTAGARRLIREHAIRAAA